MRQLAMLLVLFTTFGVAAQQHHRSKMGKGFLGEMTSEQMATLQTKKLTLTLDLTERQQQKVMEINLVQAEKRKAKYEEVKAKKESGEWKKPSADERFEMANARLDEQIAHHQKMKEILTDDQYKTWKQITLKKRLNDKKKMQEKGRRG